MKITEHSPVAKANAAKRKKEASSAGGGDFLGLLSTGDVESTPTAPPPSGIQPVSMDALLSLQEMPEDELKKRKALEESRFTLEALESLRHALLSGPIPEHLLKTLTRVVAQQKSRVEDPRLMSIIEDIELRAAVELAKLERASQPG